VADNLIYNLELMLRQLIEFNSTYAGTRASQLILHHHAVTELAESGASEQTILAIAGHVSRRMLERYSHIRLEAKRNALEALSNKSKWHRERHKNHPLFSRISDFGHKKW
jgi:hypothetical protein